MPANYRLYNTLSPASIKQWARSIGNYVYEFVEQILNRFKQLTLNIKSLNKLRDYILENSLDSVHNQACEYALMYNLLATTDLLYVLKNRKYIQHLNTTQKRLLIDTQTYVVLIILEVIQDDYQKCCCSKNAGTQAKRLFKLFFYHYDEMINSKKNFSRDFELAPDSRAKDHQQSKKFSSAK